MVDKIVDNSRIKPTVIPSLTSSKLPAFKTAGTKRNAVDSLKIQSKVGLVKGNLTRDERLRNLIARSNNREWRNKDNISRVKNTKKSVINKTAEITLDEIKYVFPEIHKKISGQAFKKGLALIKKFSEVNPEVMNASVRRSILQNEGVLQKLSDTVGFEEYIRACTYVSMKNCGERDVNAYIYAFADLIRSKYKDLGLYKGPNKEFVESILKKDAVALEKEAIAYSRTQLVVELSALSIIPSHLMFRNEFIKAIEVCSEVMSSKHNSARVRVDAARVVLEYTKPPETVKQEITVDNRYSGEVSVIQRMEKTLDDFAALLQQQAKSGKMTVEEISTLDILGPDEDVIDVEYSDENS